MKRIVWLVSVVALCVSASGCTESGNLSGSGMPDRLTPAEATEMLESLSDGQASTLDRVSMSRSLGYATDAGTHEDEIAQSGYRRADVGVIEWVNGIETKLVIPMYYGPETTYQVKGREPMAMLEAVEATPTLSGPFVFFAGPVISIEFHMDDGVLILDDVTVPVTP